MAEAQERIATAAEKQQPGKVSQLFALGGAIVSTFGIVSIIDIIKGWIGG